MVYSCQMIFLKRLFVSIWGDTVWCFKKVGEQNWLYWEPVIMTSDDKRASNVKSNSMNGIFPRPLVYTLQEKVEVVHLSIFWFHFHLIKFGFTLESYAKLRSYHGKPRFYFWFPLRNESCHQFVEKPSASVRIWSRLESNCREELSHDSLDSTSSFNVATDD